MRVAITGANGFIGRALFHKLESADYTVRAVVRKIDPFFRAVKIKGIKRDIVYIGSICLHTDWSNALQGVDIVVHLGGRAHILTETESNPLEAFRTVNTNGTKRLAQVAAEYGVKRFIYISSVGVNGKLTLNLPFTENDVATPHNDYSLSKWEAEQRLQNISNKTGIEIVIVRPPLVYGPGVKANFFLMIQWLARGLPLPLGAIHNKRSLVALDNLVDLIMTCMDHPSAANQIFLAGDGEDLSTPELLRRLGKALGSPARLFPFPQILLKLCLKMVGKEDVAQSLYGSLQVDISKARELLGWNPSVSVNNGLLKTAEWYLHEKGTCN